MVSSAHRFLRRQDPGSPTMSRHCLLHGEGIADIVFHDMYNGCIAVPRSVELWVQQEWCERGQPPLIVRLTNVGALDFDANPDPQAAREAFDRRRNPRAPRFGQRRPTRRTTGQGEEPPFTPDQQESARAAAQDTAEQVEAGLGSGQGLLNRMLQIAEALKATGHGRMLVVVDDLAGQLEELQSLPSGNTPFLVIRCLKQRWVPHINPNDALVVYLDRDRGLGAVLDGTPGVAWWPVGAPSADEIGEALVRIDARHRINLDNGAAVAQALVHHGSLREALGAVSRTYAEMGRVDPAGVLDLPEIDEAAVDTIFAELDEMVGLQALKDKLAEKRRGAIKARERIGEGKPDHLRTMHMIFTGGAGTGKTTAARTVARLFHALGLLATDNVVETTANDIVSEFQGQTRARMVAKIEEARNGVLFIDEAHQLADQHSAHVQEAKDALVQPAWDNRSNTVIILAGYFAGMSDLLARDEGLDRRFPVDNRIDFHDYTVDELWTILTRMLRKQGLTVQPEVAPSLRRVLGSRSRRSGFGNAGGVGNLVAEILAARDARPDAAVDLITTEDLPPRVVRRPVELAAARESLDAMVGLASIKEVVESLVANLRYIEVEDEELPAAPRYRFVGPPGTGKTTVARLMGQILFGAGLLDRKQVIEVNGSSVQAAYVGQTAPRVRQLFSDARGGVLFIDEAHALIPRGEGTYAREALSALAGCLTHPDNQGTVVILAGYPHEVEQLMEAEPGLRRRISSLVPFDPLTAAECVEKARGLLAAGDRPYGAEDGFFEVFDALAADARTLPNFGNAGWVENVIGGAIGRLRRRVGGASEAYDAAGRRRLLIEDLGPERVEPAAAATEPGTDEGTEASGPAARPADGQASVVRFPVRDEGFVPQALRLADAGRLRGLPREAVARQVAASVVMIDIETSTGGGHGTGFMVTHDDVVLTNWHVVNDAVRIEVYLGAGRGSAPAQIVAQDADHDLALIRVLRDDTVPPVQPLALTGSSELQAPQELLVVGNAQVRRGEEPRSITAHVARNQASDLAHFETAGAIEPGFSGGPLYQADEGVVGVVRGGLGMKGKVAIRAERALDLLHSIGYRGEEDA